jgi:hypothetical protein
MNWHHLRITLNMETLITEREMMKAANEHRAMQGFTQAYGEEHFSNLAAGFTALADELRRIGA